VIEAGVTGRLPASMVNASVRGITLWMRIRQHRAEADALGRSRSS
jgi:hypothetical protein